MQQNEVEKILCTTYPTEIAKALVENYVKACGEYRKENWQYFGNEIGQFIECSRRLIEFKLEGKYTKLESKLAIFNEKILLQWENVDSSLPEEFRLIIPRTLYAMYCIRNKRGMIHKNHIDPNRMDATLLLNNSKWVLAEIIRLTSFLSFDDTINLIDSIMNREISIIWNVGTVTRILDTKMNCADKVICLLYLKNKQSAQELKDSIEYSNVSSFRSILYRLHAGRLIEYSKSICTISPLGIQKAEKLLK